MKVRHTTSDEVMQQQKYSVPTKLNYLLYMIRLRNVKKGQKKLEVVFLILAIKVPRILCSAINWFY